MFRRNVLFAVIVTTMTLLCFVDAAQKVKKSGLIDKNENCAGWAKSGECDANPGYMRVNCKRSCAQYDKDMAETDTEVANIKSFYELKADDIDGNEVNFEIFRGKVVVVVNVASYCGYTESHYRGLVELYDEVSAISDDFEILAFPCNQFGAQEPDECSAIKDFATGKGVKFRMMWKVNVNGREAHPVFKYLKKMAGPKNISWNFATYFVVDKVGKLVSFHQIEPMDLKESILELLEHDEL